MLLLSLLQLLKHLLLLKKREKYHLEIRYRTQVISKNNFIYNKNKNKLLKQQNTRPLQVLKKTNNPIACKKNKNLLKLVKLVFLLLLIQ